MQNIRLTKPKIRFRDFSDQWVQTKLGEVTFESRDRASSINENNLQILGVNNNVGLNKEPRYFSNDLSNYKFIDKGMFAYNPMRLDVGSIGYCSTDIGKGLVSPDYVVFGCNLEFLNSDFMNQLTKRNYWKQWTSKAGAGSVRVRIYYKHLAEMKISIPSVTEQEKISDFLDMIDQRISLLTQQLELYKKYKASIFQKLFSREIRFKKDNGGKFSDWKPSILEECLEYEQPTKYIVHDTEYDDTFKTPVLTAGKSFILGHTDENENIFDKELPVIIFDDFTTGSQFVDFPFKVKSSAIKILKPINGVNIKYIYELLQNTKYKVGGHGRHWISKFSKMKILLPSSEEQIKIATFSSQIDRLINSVEEQIFLTKQWKKGLLQQMFV